MAMLLWLVSRWSASVPSLELSVQQWPRAAERALSSSLVESQRQRTHNFQAERGGYPEEAQEIEKMVCLHWWLRHPKRVFRTRSQLAKQWSSGPWQGWRQLWPHELSRGRSMAVQRQPLVGSIQKMGTTHNGKVSHLCVDRMCEVVRVLEVGNGASSHEQAGCRISLPLLTRKMAPFAEELLQPSVSAGQVAACQLVVWCEHWSQTVPDKEDQKQLQRLLESSDGSQFPGPKTQPKSATVQTTHLAVDSLQPIEPNVPWAVEPPDKVPNGSTSEVAKHFVRTMSSVKGPMATSCVKASMN